jgi:L-fuconate dehydratase
MIDFVQISADLTDRVVEFVDHLHEHFVDPCVIKNGAYVAPSAPGYSIEMYEKSLADYTFPTGKEWQKRLSETNKLVS